MQGLPSTQPLCNHDHVNLVKKMSCYNGHKLKQLLFSDSLFPLFRPGGGHRNTGGPDGEPE